MPKTYDIREDTLRTQVETMTTREIAEAYGCTQANIRYHLKKYDIKPCPPSRTYDGIISKDTPSMPMRDILAEMLSDGKTDDEMAISMGMSTNTIAYYRKKYGLRRRRSKVDDEQVYTLKKNGMTNRQIAERLGCSTATVDNHMAFVKARHPELVSGTRQCSIDRDTLQTLVSEGFEDSEIARLLGKTKTTVWKTRKAYGIEREAHR